MKWVGRGLGVKREAQGGKMVPGYENRWKILIKELVAERKDLRKKLRQAATEMESNGFQALLKILADKLRKLRAAENRREKQ